MSESIDREARTEPECYSNASQILQALSDRGCYGSVSEFLKPYEPGVDFASSLILLRRSPRWRIHAYLNVTPKLEGLPIIRRDGKSSPWMRGYMLGFESDVVTDPYLQRTGCLFVDAQAALQDWIDLFVLIFKKISQGTLLGEDDISGLWRQTLSTNKDWFGYREELEKELSNLFKWYIERWKSGKLHTDDGREKLEEKVISLIDYLLHRRDVPKAAFQGYLDWALRDFRKWGDDQNEEPPDPELLRNLIIALFLTLGVPPYDKRHLEGRNLDQTVLREKLRLNDPYNLVLQGAGDLSMNEHNLAFYHDDKGKPKVFIPEFEPFSSRRYNCLIVWRSNANPERIRKVTREIEERGIGVSLGADLSIAELRFSKSAPQIRLPDASSDFQLHDLASFAVYGKIILRNGQVLPREEVIDEFQDLRHVFALPNLSPKKGDINKLLGQAGRMIEEWRARLDEEHRASANHERLKRLLDQMAGPGEERIKVVEKLSQYASWGQQEFLPAWKHLEDRVRSEGGEAANTILFLIRHFSELRNLLEGPRHFFGLLQHTDVWLLEYALLKDSSLRHLACTAPIAVDLADLGAPKVWVTFSLLRAGYQEKRKLHEVKEPGDFAWDDSHRLFVRMRMIDYSCTIIGIGSVEKDKECDTLYLFARGHAFGRGRTIWDCAEMLRDAGAQYALVMDEGQDVFQGFLPGRFNDEFENDERKLDSLEKWMPVPFAFTEEAFQDKYGNEKRVRRLARRGLRASLVFCQG